MQPARSSLPAVPGAGATTPVLPEASLPQAAHTPLLVALSPVAWLLP